MEVDNEEMVDDVHWVGRFDHLSKILERRGPFNHDQFQASSRTLTFMRETCRVLVIGAGGLGCELLKNLALMGFRHIDVIDMDTIDVSNLNRQFLFRPSDIGKFKAEVAADFVNQRVPGTCVKAHCCKIQDKDEDFYRQFHIVVCGLDSIVARRWINAMLVSLVQYPENRDEDEDSSRESTPAPIGGIIPLVDGGTEGFKGNARIVLPGVTACIECTLDLFPPQQNFPLCTLAHTPRLPEHCVEYVRILLWPKENPFGGEGVEIDGDDPQHITWIYEKALERAAQFHIQGVTHRLTQGVVKRIIPAVASTNAVIASICANEVFKLATSAANPLQNYMVFNDSDSIYTYAYEAERNPNCTCCSHEQRHLELCLESKLQDLINLLIEDNSLRMRNPGIIRIDEHGKNKTLYMPNVASIEKATRANLKRSLSELGLEHGSEVVVADVTRPNPIVIKLKDPKERSHFEARQKNAE